jgi:hypothetical protein
MLSQAIRDRYRGAEGIADFTLGGELSRDAGYFRFGPETTCYGRSTTGIGQDRLGNALVDALPAVVVDKAQLLLPFDPDEVIDSLRLERYLGDQFGVYGQALKKLYYWIRPLTTRSIRKRIQKFQADNWEQVPFPRWPVDTTVENICETLLLRSLQAKGVERIPFVWFWPDGARGSVVMTHDVETVAGRDFCAQLLDLDESFGIRASFQIVPESRYPVTPKFLNQIRDRGFEVGVQDLNHDGRLFDDRQEFLRRAVLINRYAKEYGAAGFRAGVLYRNPAWLQDLDFSFDMSVPNVAPLDPQRGGCCTVMPYFVGNILELPVTTIQDYTLFHLLNQRSIDLWKTQLETILARHGLATFIVHPDYIIDLETRSIYEALLRWLRELRQQQALWFALPREIDQWWRARSQMSVVKDGDSWRVTGEGSERAVVAWAKVVNGQLVYELSDTAIPNRKAR